MYVYGTYANIAFRLKKVKPGPCGKILSINNFAIKFPSKIVGDQIIMSKTNIVNIYRYKTIEADNTYVQCNIRALCTVKCFIVGPFLTLHEYLLGLGLYDKSAIYFILICFHHT